ncbi:MAG: XylR family transcriptional regulator [Planctomycetaceae bacterium]|nr:XylR family transcriptional regulator [Planctomycetaceae bacterium]
MSERLRVALDIETSLVYGRRLLEGVSRYLRANRPWSIYIEQHELGSDLTGFLKRWNGDGIITRQANPESIKLLKRRHLAAIDLGDIHPHLGLLRIGSAQVTIGRLAAEHLLERGFEHFACCGFEGEHWSQRRRDGFIAEIGHAGFHTSVFESPRAGVNVWKRDQQRLVEWINSLPRPVGVFATNDMRGQHVLDACARLDLAVPEQVAVLGVDNDELVCNLCNPPLSSIIPNPERIGFEAAGWLDRMMQGETPAAIDIEIPPLGIAVRQSSDVFAVSDPTLASALRFIRERACDGATVTDLLAHLSVSRSWLERNFRKLLNRSPQAEIRMVQIKRCKELLRTTNLSLEKIAGLAGFEHPEYMSVVFKRETGRTPGQYRSNGSSSSGSNGNGAGGNVAGNGSVAVEMKKRNGVMT